MFMLSACYYFQNIAANIIPRKNTRTGVYLGIAYQLRNFEYDCIKRCKRLAISYLPYVIPYFTTVRNQYTDCTLTSRCTLFIQTSLLTNRSWDTQCKYNQIFVCINLKIQNMHVFFRARHTCIAAAWIPAKLLHCSAEAELHYRVENIDSLVNYTQFLSSCSLNHLPTRL